MAALPGLGVISLAQRSAVFLVEKTELSSWKQGTSRGCNDFPGSFALELNWGLYGHDIFAF